MLSSLKRILGLGTAAPQAGKAGTICVSSVPTLETPILLFMESAAFISAFEPISSWKVVHVRTLQDFRMKLSERRYAMLIALSPQGCSGAAGEAIREFRMANPEALTVYHGWDPRLSMSGPRALACQADVLVVGGVCDGDLVYLLGTAFLLKKNPNFKPSLTVYEALLKETCARSPFWKMQRLEMPANPIE